MRRCVGSSEIVALCHTRVDSQTAMLDGRSADAVGSKTISPRFVVLATTTTVGHLHNAPLDDSTNNNSLCSYNPHSAKFCVVGWRLPVIACGYLLTGRRSAWPGSCVHLSPKITVHIASPSSLCLHSNWPKLMAPGSVKVCIVGDFLPSLFARCSLSNIITTDNGPQFIFAKFAAFVEERGIKHNRTSFYQHEANGGVESLKNGIRTYLTEGLPFPTALLHPSPLPDNAALNYKLPDSTDVGPGTAAFLALAKRLSNGHTSTTPSLRAKVDYVQRRIKQQFDRRQRAKAPPFKTGDWVWVRRPN